MSLAPAPAIDPRLSVPGGVWEETFRRYLLGAAAAMDLPPEGATIRAAADASEVVCKWVCSGGPTAMPTPPDTGTVMTPSASATLAAALESLPKPSPALAASNLRGVKTNDGKRASPPPPPQPPARPHRRPCGKLFARWLTRRNIVIRR